MTETAEANATPMQNKEIELHNGDQPRLRTTISARCSVVTVPVKMDGGGFGQIDFMSSGLRTADGIEIWTPQKRMRQ